MADKYHLDILSQGREVWNQWRKEHPYIQPDLSDTHLPEVDLGMVLHTGPYPTNTERRVVNLNGCNLSNTNLVGSKLHGADLSNSTLLGSNLSRADLREANLQACNLNHVYLYGTDLTRANLQGADLKGTVLGMTIFGDVDLSAALGLEYAFHYGPSIIGTDTLFRSHGIIPEVFLQRTGVPEPLITYLHFLVDAPISYYTCFISNASQDVDIAKRLYADLQSRGVRCWYAPEDLKIGDHYHQRIDEAICHYDKLILILSEHAVQSPWVEREVVTAREKEDREQRSVLFPIRLDDAVMDTTKAWAADVRRRWHIGDFTQWKHHDVYQQAFQRLLRDLKAEQTSER